MYSDITTTTMTATIYSKSQRQSTLLNEWTQNYGIILRNFDVARTTIALANLAITDLVCELPRLCNAMRNVNVIESKMEPVNYCSNKTMLSSKIFIYTVILVNLIVVRWRDLMNRSSTRFLGL